MEYARRALPGREGQEANPIRVGSSRTNRAGETYVLLADAKAPTAAKGSHHDDPREESP
jgi:hypothetical protein